MIVLLLSLFSGVLFGRFFRKHSFSYISRLIWALVAMLLFLMGLEVGCNPAVFSRLSTIGGLALLIGSVTTLFCAIGAWLLLRHIQTKKSHEK